jgi:hypothetical protein
MPKIEDLLKEKRFPPLQRKVLDYLDAHPDEVFSNADAQELAKSIGYKDSINGIRFSFKALDDKNLISKERLGRRVYFGTEKAISKLRKEGALSKPIKETVEHAQSENVPSGMPKALTQTLDVIHLVKTKGFSRPRATNEIAKSYGIAPQTVMDKYTRQLGGINTLELDTLLKQDNLAELKSLLLKANPSFKDKIESFFSA